ncbi:MAG: class I SAM-dependent methyltransferase [Bacteroidota bacterium]
MPTPSDPAFWNVRFGDEAFAYGTAPNAFVAEAVPTHVAPGSTVLELAAGEGRNAVWMATRGYGVTALDFAAEGLAKTNALAAEHGVTVATVQADVTAWDPPQEWDAVVATFLHLPEAVRPAVYALARRALRPGGLFIAEWYRPEQVTGGYTSGGPRDVTMTVSSDEVLAHFGRDPRDNAGLLVLDTVEAVLDEGLYHQGLAALTRVVWKKPRA